MTYFNYIY